MIEVINIKKQQMTEFEKKYFSFMEAPEDEERTNVRKIRLKVSDGRRYDFRKGADGGDETPPEETTEETPADDTGDDAMVADDDLDDTDMDDMGDDGGGDDDIVTDDDIGDSDDMGADDTGDDEDMNAGDDGANADGNTDDDIATDDEAQNGDVTGDDTGGDDSGDTENDGDGNTPENADVVRKQNLYRKFTNLYTAIDHYIHKLSSLIGVEEETNQSINSVSSKLKEIKEKIYDYMIIRFTKSSYEQSDLFYHRSVVAVAGLFDILEKIVDHIYSDGKEDKKGKSKGKKRD